MLHRPAMIPDLVVDAVAAYRLTRLATADSITAPLRDAIVAGAYERADPAGAHEIQATHGGSWSQIAMDDEHPPRLAELVTCRWCTGWWVAALIVWARRRHPRWWAPVADVAACSAAAALLARLER